MIEFNFIHLKPHVQSPNQFNWATSLSLNNPKFVFLFLFCIKTPLKEHTTSKTLMWHALMNTFCNIERYTFFNHIINSSFIKFLNIY